MPDADYARCRYSISVQTPDLAVLHCLRALTQHAEGSTIPKNITWGGTKESAWRRDGRTVTFRFTSPTYRDAFVAEAVRLLPTGSWTEVARSDTDPAVRQRR